MKEYACEKILPLLIRVKDVLDSVGKGEPPKRHGGVVAFFDRLKGGPARNWTKRRGAESERRRQYR